MKRKKYMFCTGTIIFCKRNFFSKGPVIIKFGTLDVSYCKINVKGNNVYKTITKFIFNLQVPIVDEKVTDLQNTEENTIVNNIDPVITIDSVSRHRKKSCYIIEVTNDLSV